MTFLSQSQRVIWYQGLEQTALDSAEEFRTEIVKKYVENGETPPTSISFLVIGDLRTTSSAHADWPLGVTHLPQFSCAVCRNGERTWTQQMWRSSHLPTAQLSRYHVETASLSAKPHGVSCCLYKQSRFCLSSLILMTGGLDKVRWGSYLETLKSYISKDIIFSVFKPNLHRGAIWDKHSHAMFWVSAYSACVSFRIAYNGSCWFPFFFCAAEAIRGSCRQSPEVAYNSLKFVHFSKQEKDFSVSQQRVLLPNTLFSSQATLWENTHLFK